MHESLYSDFLRHTGDWLERPVIHTDHREKELGFIRNSGFYRIGMFNKKKVNWSNSGDAWVSKTQGENQGHICVSLA